MSRNAKLLWNLQKEEPCRAKIDVKHRVFYLMKLKRRKLGKVIFFGI